MQRALGDDLNGRQIAALGLAYKPDVDDLRESPAIEIVHLLRDAGAKVTAFEPFKPDFAIPGCKLRRHAGRGDRKRRNARCCWWAMPEFKQLVRMRWSQLTPARVGDGHGQCLATGGLAEAWLPLIRLGVRITR